MSKLKVTPLRILVGIVAGAVIIVALLFVGVSLYFQVSMNRESNYIKETYSTINLPNSLVLQSSKKGTDDFMSTWTYNYAVKPPSADVLNSLQSALMNQGFVVNKGTNSLYASNKSKNISLSAVAHESNIGITAEKIGNG